jgi:hypothetical protein
MTYAALRETWASGTGFGLSIPLFSEAPFAGVVLLSGVGAVTSATTPPVSARHTLI